MFRVLPSAVVAVFLLSTPAFGQMGERETPAPPVPVEAGPVITVPAKIRVNPGQPFRVPVQTNCRWFECDVPAGLTVVPSDWLASARDVVGIAAEGVYTLTFRGSLNDVQTRAVCVLTVGIGPPVPPGPTPPQPVPPPPKPPEPSDPLTAELQKLYAGEHAAAKAQQKADLSALYRRAAGFAVTDQTVRTVGELFTKLRQAGDLMLGDPTALKSVRDRIGEEHKSRFAPQSRPLDDAIRKSAGEWFARVATMLESIK